MSTQQPATTSSQAEPDMSQWFQNYLKRLEHRPKKGLDPPMYRPWTPPHDPHKPSFPYLPGFKMNIHRHCSDDILPRPSLSDEYLKTVTHTESVVINPSTDKMLPLGSDAPDSLSAQLNIKAPIAIGEVRGPQLVACTIAPGTQGVRDGNHYSTSFKAAAKIYDALYYNFKDNLGDDPQDCVYQAENDYRTETAAYRHLDSHRQTGTFAPEYYGSWTFVLAVDVNGVSQTRNVRLILIELLDGPSLQALRVQNHHHKWMGTDAFHYPQEYRLEVLARAMDGYVRQLKTGLCQRDFAGRNVVLCADNNLPEVKVLGLGMPRVVLVDYNIATVNRDLTADATTGLPDNPAAIFWTSDLFGDFPGWVPKEWFDIRLQKKWLLERFGREDLQDTYRPLPSFVQSLEKNSKLCNHS